MHTTKYRIWVRPGKEQLLKMVWQQHVDMLRELGLETGWVAVCSRGECVAYLQWRSRQYWENVRDYCQLMDEVARGMGDSMLGWLSEHPGMRVV